MKLKPQADELRMDVAEFEKIMRRALSAPPPKAKPTKPASQKRKKPTKK